MREWQERIDGQMAQREDRAARRSMAVNYPNELYALVMEAARLRGLNMTAYQRRASLAFAEYDLGFDWVDSMRVEPPIGPFASPRAREDRAGSGYGYWRIVRLDDHV